MKFSDRRGLWNKISGALPTIAKNRAIIYLALVVTFYLALSVLDAMWEFRGFHGLKATMHRLADALLFALPVWGMRRKRWLFPWIGLVTLYLLANAWYYRNYGTIMPLSSFLLVQNLPTVGESLLLSLRWSDLVLILPPVLFMLGYAALPKAGPERENTQQGEGNGRRPLGSRRFPGFALALGLILLINGPRYLFARYCAADQDPIYRNLMEPIRAIREYGFTNFWIFQLSYMKDCSPEEIEFASRFVETAERKHPKNQLVDPHNKNLILILVESLCSWPVNLTVDGVEVTPYLNALTRDTTVLYLPKVMPQVKDGRSSDAQLMLNTGLLPLASGATSGIYGSTNTYPSLPKALKNRGYTSISLTCDNKTFWNQDATCRSYGFDRLYERLDNGRLRPESDQHLFENALPILLDTKQPFYAQLVTFSGHDPVDTDFESSLRHSGIQNREVLNYLIITQFVDHHLGRFIERLRDSGLYDNSILVIVGDHDSTITRDRYENRPVRNPEDRFIPLFILNAPLSAPTDRVIAQSDLFPSLLDLMGVADYPFHGLGESLFRHQPDCAVDWTGTRVGNNTDDSVRQRRFEAWRVSDILLRSDLFAGKF